ncbi:SDR family NAD(P)-dependent oxidoreductase [Mastigocoleus testarum]|uniref:Short-chain dehydrogenase n=1 Tax=Mastigocoleus testarum BC008 TaxID=371196 RepID=A0A0V7ZBH5_9CYAN|nr:glucose 1-dehydrogenase [Mastigocoleus testarum]KST61875.1 short-chain dehydrogenase [Mastigocoleus testarum BC008]
MSNVTRRKILTTGVVGATGVASAFAVGKELQANTKNSPQAQNTTNSQSRFANKAVLITGATSGIGQTTAKAFAREGAKVFFCGRRENLGAQVEREIRDLGKEATYMRADIRKPEEVKAFVDACVAKYGRLDIAFNNAGIDYPPKPIAETAIAEFDDLMNTNARGVFLGMKYEIPHMLKTKGGVIINTASIGGARAFPNIIGYGASKAAVIHMTKMAAQEYGKNIRINAISPGAIDTPMLDRVKRDWKVTEKELVASYPMQRVGTPEEVANLVMWLASDEASYVSGNQFSVDGGGLG